MITQFWTSQSLIRSLYSAHLEPVCKKHGLTRMEVDLLLFLANNPSFDTATDIIEKRQLTKSHVSLAVHSLAEKGYLARSYSGSNRKTIHLSVCDLADDIVSDGRKAQKAFAQVLFKDFSPQDIETMVQLFVRIDNNIHNHLKEDQ